VEEQSDAGCALNAADEVAVQAFLDERIDFQGIVAINRTVLERRPGRDDSIEQLLEADVISRELAREEVDAAAESRAATAPGA
jgi:1-deoxy-D-xylulose-5-phosphate reductoisomerase